MLFFLISMLFLPSSYWGYSHGNHPYPHFIRELCSPIQLANSHSNSLTSFTWLVEPFLVGVFSPPLWKMMEWKSVGMMTFPTEWKVIIQPCSKPPTRLKHHKNSSSITYAILKILRIFGLWWLPWGSHGIKWGATSARPWRLERQHEILQVHRCRGFQGGGNTHLNATTPTPMS